GGGGGAGLGRRAGEAGAGLQDTIADAGANVRDAASSAYDAAAERTRQGADAFSRNARMMRDNLASSGQSLLGFLQQQPLVLAGIGLAIGGVLRAGQPRPPQEEHLLC